MEEDEWDRLRGKGYKEETGFAREINYVFPLSDMRSTEEVWKVR